MGGAPGSSVVTISGRFSRPSRAGELSPLRSRSRAPLQITPQGGSGSPLRPCVAEHAEERLRDDHRPAAEDTPDAIRHPSPGTPAPWAPSRGLLVGHRTSPREEIHRPARPATMLRMAQTLEAIRTGRE